MTKKKMKVNMKINIDRDQFYDVEVDKLKILMKADTLYLMDIFLLEGIPFYDSSSKDLYNLFDSDEKNSHSMDIKKIIKHLLICLLSDDCII